MLLAQTSDDSLAQILSFLTGQDVLRLMATGSKRFIARVSRSTTHLDRALPRPTHFPSSSFSLTNLKSLSIKGNTRYGHLSLHNRSIFPLEPMPLLESLHLDFPQAHLVFAPAHANRGMTLSSSFPNLTYLTIASGTDCPIPDGWAESLPKGLTHLDLNICYGSDDPDLHISPSSFKHLPTGLQHLNCGIHICIGPGDHHFLRLTDLRVLRIGSAHSWDALMALPDSLEELSCTCYNYDLPKTTFPISKFPPRIRTLKLIGGPLEVNCDSMAPSTLEELILGLGHTITAENFERFFDTKNFRKLQGVDCSSPECFKLLPSLEEITRAGKFPSDLDTIEILPEKLKSLFLSDGMRISSYNSSQPLLPLLEKIDCYPISPEDVSGLPRNLTSIDLKISSRNQSLKVPTAVWRNLPPKLTRLATPLALFESEESLHALPDKLQELILDLSILAPPNEGEVIPSMTRLPYLSDSLRKLSLWSEYHGKHPRPLALDIPAILLTLGEFSALTTLSIYFKSTLNSASLAYLPKTLIEMVIGKVEFENFGLPVGQSPENHCDWKEGALSRLPDGLQVLFISYWQATPGSIDFNLFSRLPPHLVSLHIDPDKDFCRDPKTFVSKLPRNLDMISFSLNSRLGQLEPNPVVMMEEAIQDYYSDAFWSGHMLARSPGPAAVTPQ